MAEKGTISRNPGLSFFLFTAVLLCTVRGHGTNDIYQVELPNDQDQPTKAPYKVNENGTIWAVLVAGSNSYYNYRHQADICHAYQILIRNGVSAENIITMMYDDVAYDENNPTPGVIINRPNGPDVYSGVVIDYKGKDVTPDVFRKVLLGDKEGLKGVGSGKVLKSGPDDHVFINFADHGAPGMVCFPSEDLHARELISILEQMYGNKSYNKLVFYMEACESGSMFKGLLQPHWNIFATTAANDQESSYACYMDNFRGTYLGDVYSVMWMENSDQANLESETLQAQFLIVKEETNTSHVQEFGDRSLRQLPVADFLGETEPERKTPLPKVELNPVLSEDVVKEILQHRYMQANSTEEKKNLRWKLKRFHKLRKLVRSEMTEIVSKVTKGDEKEEEILHNSRHTITNWDCYEKVARAYSNQCFSIAKNPYVTRVMYVFVNMCERGWKAEDIVDAMHTTCHHSTLYGIH